MKKTSVHDGCSSSDAGGETTGKGQRAGMVAAGGSVMSALAASACCWIPLLFIALGVSAGGAAAWFEQYRWLFLGLTAILLGSGFYSVYFTKSRCAAGSACAAPNRRLLRFNRVTLWMATVVVIATAAFPKYVGYLIPKRPTAQVAGPVGEWKTVSLGIDGMTCQACAVSVRNALVGVPGVLGASVSHTDSTAALRFDSLAPPSEADLQSAITGAGFKADTSAMKP